MSVISAVYGIICLGNRKVYVGQSRNVKNRLKNHKYKLRKKVHENEFLQRAWNKYGEEMFSFVILELTPETKLMKVEQKWMKKLRSFTGQFGFNKNRNK